MTQSAKTMWWVMALLGLGACMTQPVQEKAAGPEILIVYEDGSMEFRNRPISEEDVVIYEDGYGGERAAIKVLVEPLHPNFYRDTIVVERRSGSNGG